jgi:drug/metabolite transporter (DMT)-like permease
MSTRDTGMDLQSWSLLVFLSILWGGSFYFAGVAVKEMSPLVIVLARVAIAAVVLAAVHFVLLGPLPRDAGSWRALFGMAVLNNVIPFTCIVFGQTLIASGLASVINATTPLFGIVVLAWFGQEALTLRRSLGLAIGIAGIVVLKGSGMFQLGNQTVGILLCLSAAISYGIAGLWAKLHLAGFPVLTAATGQLICSTCIMLPMATAFDSPLALAAAPASALWSVLALALLSTALAYIVFFRIIARAGAGNVMLVTMMIPVSAIMLGHFLLKEALHVREIVGALIIAAALLIIDGRLVHRLWPR